MQQALEAIYLIALCGKPCGAATLLQALHAGCGHVQQFGAGAHAFAIGNIAHQARPGGDERAMRHQMREDAAKARAALQAPQSG